MYVHGTLDMLENYYYFIYETKVFNWFCSEKKKKKFIPYDFFLNNSIII